MYPSLWSRALSRTVTFHRAQMSRKQRRALRRVRPALEHLEDRVTPSTIPINVNDPSGGMDNPANVTVATLASNVTLIDAINAANNSGGSDSYVIKLPTNAFIKFTQPLNNTTVTSNNVVQDQNWYGPDALPAITSNITIQGDGSTLLIVPNTNMRFFYVSGGPALTGGALPLGTLELDNLTLKGGMAQGGSGANGGLGAGGAIFNQGNLTLKDDTLTDNQAIGGNGGLVGVAGGIGGGGGMGSDGDSSEDGGGFGGGFSIPGGPQGGAGDSGGGGGAGFQSFDGGNSSFGGNGAAGGGQGGFGGTGGDTNDAGGDGGGGGVGGSSAQNASGGSFGSGGGSSFYTDGGGGGGIGGGGGGTSNLSPFSGGGGFGGGGGYGGGGGFGGGGFVAGFGGGGGGIFGNGGGAGMGGGIFSMFGSATILNSTLSGNTAQGGNSSGSGLGGAIFNLDGNVTLIYATIANNSVHPGTVAGFASGDGDANGGGVYNLAYGNTLAGKANTALLTLDNSVIGQNENYGLAHDLVNDAENGKTTNTAQINGSSSIVQGGAFQTGNGTTTVADGAITVTSPPNLATTLQGFGDTLVLLPLTGSPVIGAGNASLVGLPSVDQVGIARPNSTSTIKPDDGAFQTSDATTTSLLTPSVSTTFNSTTPQTVALSAAVTGSNGEPVNEGLVVFTVSVGDSDLTAKVTVHDGMATAMLTVPAGFAAGTYSFGASYVDTSSLYQASDSATDGTLTVNTATLTTTPLDIANVISGPGKTQSAMLAANVSSANGGTVNEGSVTFTLINPHGPNLTATANVSKGTATTTLTLPAGFAPGTYVYVAGYADGNNVNGVPNYAAISGAATVDPPDGTLTVVDPPTDSGAAAPPTSPPPVSPLPVSIPIGSLSLFAFGLGPTGIDLFEVDGQGDIFAQSLFGGSPVLVSTALHLSSALLTNDALLGLLAASDGQNYFIHVFDPLLPSIESAVLAALQL